MPLPNAPTQCPHNVPSPLKPMPATSQAKQSPRTQLPGALHCAYVAVSCVAIKPLRGVAPLHEDGLISTHGYYLCFQRIPVGYPW